MALASMQSPAARIGKFKGEILKSILPREVLSLTSDSKQLPKNSSDTVTWRRWLPYNATISSPNTFFVASETGDRTATLANQHLSAEGVTPNAESLVPQDLTVTLNEYTVLFGYTKRMADLYEDNVPAEMRTATGTRMSLVRELVRFNALKACTNKDYGGTGSTRTTVNGTITLKLLHKIVKGLDLNHTEKITSILKASMDYGTSAVEASYIVYVHTDLKPDVRNLEGFTHVSQYGNMKPISQYEFGNCEEFRFIASPELVSIINAATSTTAATYGLATTGGTNPDVYQMVVVGKDAWGDITLRGSGVGGFELHDVPPGHKDSSDPTGQRGYIGASCYFAAALLNSGHMCLAEVGCTAD